MKDDLIAEVWERLSKGRTLDDLPIPMHAGRRDLRGLKVPEKPAARKFSLSFGAHARANSGRSFERSTWEALDFTGSHLVDLQFSMMTVDNCLFDRCKLQNLRVWASTFSDCSFFSANLRNAALGAVVGDTRNSFLRVDFSRADMAGTVYTAAAFEGCSFKFSKLSGVDFQSSTFKDCVFEGELKDVLFYRYGFKGEQFPPNEMINVDLRRAKLRDVAFRGLTLEHVLLPEDQEHVVIEDYASALRQTIPLLREDADETARRVIAFLEMESEWLPQARTRAVINLEDLEETAGREGVDRLLRLLPK